MLGRATRRDMLHHFSVRSEEIDSNNNNQQQHEQATINLSNKIPISKDD